MFWILNSRKKNRINIILTILLALLCNLGKIENNEISETIEDEKLSELSGDYTSALNNSTSQNNYYAHLFLGKFYHIQNEYVKSLTQYNTSILIDEKKAAAYFYRGNLQIDLGSSFGAISDYNTAIKNDPNVMQYYMCRGFAHSNIGDFYNAINDYSIAIQLNPISTRSYYNMGKINGIVSDLTLACEKIIKIKDTMSIRAESVYMNFFLI